MSVSQEFSRQRTGTGTQEWSEVSANIQSGCANDCKYCYAAAKALRLRRISKRSHWSFETVNLDAVNKKWRKVNGVIMFPTEHDITARNLPFAIVALRNMLVPGNSILVVTKPRLDCIIAICDELSEYRDRILFRFTIGSVDPDLCAFWEPGAPEPHERIAALGYAYVSGYRTSVSMEPMLAGTDMAISTYRTVERFVNETVWIGKMNKMRSRVYLLNNDNLAAVEMLEHLQRDEEILRLVAALAGEAKVRWKDSIREISKNMEAKMREVTIYVDGACSGNPGPGGWGAVLIDGAHEREISGSHPDTTTNSRMELTAAIEALRALKYPCRVRLFSDSSYLVNAFRLGWIERWLENGWRTRSKPRRQVENIDLWKELLVLVERHKVTFEHVAGHAGVALNERADRLAREAIVRERSGEVGCS